MTALGELFDVAVARLREAAAEPLALDPQEQAGLADGVVQVLEQIGKGLGPRAFTPVLTTDERDLTLGEQRLRHGLQLAERWLGTAQAYLLGGSGGASGVVDGRVRDAELALAAVRDTIGSHLSPDRAPLTAYAYLLRHQAAFDYLTHRYSEVAWAGGQVVARLTRGAEHPGAAEAFETARVSLNQASVHARAAARSADPALASFPLALPVVPVRASVGDLTSAVMTRLQEDSERLSRAAYEALHDRAEQRLSGSDLKQLSEWTARTRMLAGRLLRHVAESAPDEAVAAGLFETAGTLRASARSWDAVAQKWNRVVDLSDPREHPSLPPPGLGLVRAGKATRIPTTDPHPAVVISHAACARIGQLLFGAQWTPDQRPGVARPAANILADAGGVGPLAASLYRLPVAGWQMAAAAPWAVKRAGSGLVTNDPAFRPAQLDRTRTFFPVHRRQAEVLTAAYVAVMGAEQHSAGRLLEVARQAGTAVPRAVLDASAHQMIAREQKWVTAMPVQGPPRDLPRAHVPTELLTGRRPGLSS
ncbi:hypothetical protein ACFXKW_37500 [Streptomyces sp. NPDC059193]|uniref:hypothetical protein n=1 Tax=Streptomyces sp. NPDC059193 TaxID=3346763 RepID=UPI0036A045A4